MDDQGQEPAEECWPTGRIPYPDRVLLAQTTARMMHEQHVAKGGTAPLTVVAVTCAKLWHTDELRPGTSEDHDTLREDLRRWAVLVGLHEFMGSTYDGDGPT